MPDPKPKLVTPRKAYVPTLSKTERLAYAAAHRILSERPYTDRLAAPGGRRTAIVDGMAKIIMETFSSKKQN